VQERHYTDTHTDTMRTMHLLSVIPLAFLLCAHLCTAHICMFHPAQRGGFSLDQPGDASCVRNPAAGPCAGMPAGAPVATFPAGSSFKVEFQQSLNHWYGPKPGQLLVQIAKGANPSEEDFTYLFGQAVPDWNAMDEVSWMNVTVWGQLPSTPSAHSVLRLSYITNNPEETTFHQCADITISAPEVDEKEKKSGASSARPPADVAAARRRSDLLSALSSVGARPAPREFPIPTGCTTIPQWESFLISSGASSGAFVGSGSVSFDGKAQLQFVALEDDTANIVEAHFLNYTSGIEFRFLRDLAKQTSTCTVYGLDQYSDWSYGAAANEQYVMSVALGTELVSVYGNEAADIYWGVVQAGGSACIPAMRMRSTDHSMQLFYNVTAGIQDPRVFVPPPECKVHEAYELVQGADLQATRAHAATLPRAPPSPVERSRSRHDVTAIAVSAEPHRTAANHKRKAN